MIAVEPSASMRNALRTGKAEHGLANLRIVAGAWPAALADLGDPPVADVAFIAHVGYDIEEIGPFLDAMDAAASRMCVAMLTDRSPASVADPFWPEVHGMERIPLPALPKLAEAPPGTWQPDRDRARRAGAADLRFSSTRLGDVHPPPALDRGRRREGAAVPRGTRSDGPRDRRRRLDLASPPVGSIGILTWSPAG